MEILILPDADAVANAAADIIRDLVTARPTCVLGLATGSTPEATYARLVRDHTERGLDFGGVSTFNLDEYLGLPGTHEQSYRHFMNTRLFDHINIAKGNTHVPSGVTSDPERECELYEQRIEEAGGIDLQLLGIGTDGHIAFNEPGSSLSSRTRVKTLTEQTIRDNARLFFGEGNEESVPRFAITMGVGTILEARRLLLIATGQRKAAIVREMLEGPVTSRVTASAIQMHPDVTVILDEAAAADLEHRDYYTWVQSQKGAYQELLARLKE